MELNETSKIDPPYMVKFFFKKEGTKTTQMGKEYHFNKCAGTMGYLHSEKMHNSYLTMYTKAHLSGS